MTRMTQQVFKADLIVFSFCLFLDDSQLVNL